MEVDSEHALLKCPKCPNRLRALLLEMFEEDGQRYQKVWWTCRGIKNNTCIFPLNMPPEVFWTRRTEEQMNQDVIPLPNFHLLPKQYWSLYPSLFSTRLVKPPLETRAITSSAAAHSIAPASVARQASPSSLSAPKLSSFKYNKRLSGLQPIEHRIIAGGHKFDPKIIDEAAPADGSSSKLFHDPQSALKSALAIRFAKHDFLDRISNQLYDVPPPNKKLKKDTAVATEEADSEDLRYSDGVTGEVLLNKKQQKLLEATLNSRLGRRHKSQYPVTTRSTPSREDGSYDLVERSDLSSCGNPSTASVPSPSSLDSGSFTSQPVSVQPTMTEFASPELHGIFARHLQVLRTKAEQKKKRRKKSKGRESTRPETPQISTSASPVEPLDNFQDQSKYVYDDDDLDYDIFDLGSPESTFY